MKIGSKIKQIRELRNYTQEYVADKLGMSIAGYSRIERNQVDVNFEKLNKIASVFNVQVAELIKFDDEAIFSIQNLTNSVNGNKVNIQFNENEKKLYEALIEQLKNEITFLKSELKRERELKK